MFEIANSSLLEYLNDMEVVNERWKRQLSNLGFQQVPDNRKRPRIPKNGTPAGPMNLQVLAADATSYSFLYRFWYYTPLA